MAARRFAEDGCHFVKVEEVSRTIFICKIFPCIEIFPSCRSYHNHALHAHGLFQVRQDPKRGGRKKKKGSTGGQSKQKPKPGSVTAKSKRKLDKSTDAEDSIFCRSYLRLRGDTIVRWAGTKGERRVSFREKSERYFRLVYGPEPSAPCANLYIEVMEKALPLIGEYNAWESLLDDAFYEMAIKWVNCSDRSNAVFDWCEMLQKSLVDNCPPEEDDAKYKAWHCTMDYIHALKRIFKKKDWKLQENVNKIHFTRNCMKKGAAHFLQHMRARLLWITNTSEDKIQARADAAYSKWKSLHKEKILDTQRQNIYYTLTRHFNRTHEQAIDEGLLQIPIIDTSEEEDAPRHEVPEFHYRDEVNELSQHVDVVETLPSIAPGSCTDQMDLLPKVLPQTNIGEEILVAEQVTVPDTEDDVDDDFEVTRRKGVRIPHGRTKLAHIRRQARIPMVHHGTQHSERDQPSEVPESLDESLDFPGTLYVPSQLGTPQCQDFMAQFDSLDPSEV